MDRFIVKVYPSGQLYPADDPSDRHLAIAGDGVFGFRLPEGMTAEGLETTNYRTVPGALAPSGAT